MTQRLMGLDVGSKRIGIAVSDSLQITVRPHSTIARNRKAYSAINELAQEMEVELIVIGLPLHLDGSEGAQAQDVRSFAAKLRGFCPIPIQFQDERLSSIDAEERMDTRRRIDREKVDSVAAAVILEDYLQQKK